MQPSPATPTTDHVLPRVPTDGVGRQTATDRGIEGGIHSESVKAEFKGHAAEELTHADMLATRILQLGGTPDFSPAGLTKSRSGYGVATDLRGMLTENLVAERAGIESYRALIAHVGAADPTTRRMLEEILAKEEEHADDLPGLLGNVEAR